MKLNGKITFLINQDETTIEIMDDNSSISFVKIILTPQQLSNALSRLGRTDCELNVFNLDKVGKKMIIKEFTYELPKNIKKDDDEKLAEYAKYLLNQNEINWIPDQYFKSQNSFFTKDNINYFRGIARRWI